MKMDFKFLAYIASIFFVSITSLLFLHNTINKQIEEAKISRQNEIFSTVSYLFNSMSSGAKTLSKDYSLWDDMVEFVKTENTVWADENIVEAAINFNANFVAVYNADKKLIYTHSSDETTLDTENYIDVSKFNFDKPEFYSFYINNENKLIALYAAPIQATKDINRKSKPNGYFVTGFYWSQKQIKSIEDISNCKLSFSFKNEDNARLNSILLKGVESQNIVSIIPIPNSISSIVLSDFYPLILATFFILCAISAIFYFVFVAPMKKVASCIKDKKIKQLSNIQYYNGETDTIVNHILFCAHDNTILNQYKDALDETSIVSKTNEFGLITYANENFCKISGYALEELIGKPHSIIRHPSTHPEVFKQMWLQIKNGKVWKGILKNTSKNGTAYVVQTTIIPIFDEHNQICEYIAIRNDITQVIKQEQILLDQSIDSHTKLPNRYKLMTDIGYTKSFKRLSLINIERFRDINEVFGHQVADEVLKIFAIELSKIAPNQVIVYRIGGDEFAFLDKFGMYSEDEFSLINRNIISHFHKFPIIIDANSILLSVRIGLSSGINDLYINSELAITQAKEKKHNFVLFNDHSDYFDIVKNNINWVNKIKLAIDADRFVPVFQKIFSLKNQSRPIYEALMRYVDDDGNLVRPDKFLNIAKKARLYEDLTALMIDKVFAIAKQKDITFTINISIFDILNLNTRNHLLKAISNYEIATHLIIEVVDINLTNDDTEVFDFLQKLKVQKVRLALDDFGDSCANFDHIARLNIDYLKINGSMLTNIENRPTKQKILKSIVDFASSLDIKTIAKQIESEESLAYSRNIGIDFVQGNHLSIPSKEI